MEIPWQENLTEPFDKHAAHIETMARAMCRAHDIDPDAWATNNVLLVGPGFSVIPPLGAQHRAWTFFEKSARAAYEEMGWDWHRVPMKKEAKEAK